MNHFSPSAPRFIEPLEARIAPVADIAAQFVSFTLPSTAVPGDFGKITFNLVNVGDEDIRYQGGIHAYFSSDQSGEVGDDEIGRITGPQGTPLDFALPKGKSVQFSISFNLPGLTLPAPDNPAGGYYIVVDVDPRNLNDSINGNDDAASPQFNYAFQFGNVGDRKNVKLYATDNDGSSGVFVLEGKGVGELFPNGSSVDLTISGSDASTKVGTSKSRPVSGGDNRITLRNIMTTAPVNIVSMVGVNITGEVNLGYGAAGFRAEDIGGPSSQIYIGGDPASGKPVDINLGRVNDLDMGIVPGIATLRVLDWRNPNADPDDLITPFINKLEVIGKAGAGVAGDFEANVTLNRPTIGVALGKATIAGKLQKGSLTVSNMGATVGKIVADGANQWKLLAAGGVDTLEIKKDLIGDKSAPSIQAVFFDDIKVGGKLDAYVQATGQAKDELGIDKLDVTTVNGAIIEAPAGGMNKVDLGEWINGGSLSAYWIKTLTTDGKGATTAGDFSAALAVFPPSTLDGRPDVPSGVKGAISKLAIAGALKGATWNVSWKLPQFTAGSIAADWLLSGSDGTSSFATDIGKLKVTGAVAGKLRAHHFDDVTFIGDFSGELKALGDKAHLNDLTAGKISGGVVEATGVIYNVTAEEWNTGSIKGSTIDLLKITGSTAKGLAGNLAFVNITTTDAAEGTLLGLDLVALGSLTSVNMSMAATLNSIQADEWIGGTATTRRFGSLDLGGDVRRNLQGDLVGVTITSTATAGRIPNVTLSGTADNAHLTFAIGASNLIFGRMYDSTVDVLGQEIKHFEIKTLGTGGTAFRASQVTAGRINEIIVRNVDEGGGGNDYGITVDSLGSYTRIAGGTVESSESNLDSAPNGNPVDSAGKYRLVVN